MSNELEIAFKSGFQKEAQEVSDVEGKTPVDLSPRQHKEVKEQLIPRARQVTDKPERNYLSSILSGGGIGGLAGGTLGAAAGHPAAALAGLGVGGAAGAGIGAYSESQRDLEQEHANKSADKALQLLKKRNPELADKIKKKREEQRKKRLERKKKKEKMKKLKEERRNMQEDRRNKRTKRNIARGDKDNRQVNVEF